MAGFAYADPEIGRALAAEPVSARPPLAVPPPPGDAEAPAAEVPAQEPAPPPQPAPPQDPAAPQQPEQPQEPPAPPAQEPPAPPAQEPPAPPGDDTPPGDPAGTVEDPAPMPEIPEPSDEAQELEPDEAPEVRPGQEAGSVPGVKDPEIAAAIQAIKKAITKKATSNVEDRMNAVLKYLGCPVAAGSASGARMELKGFAAEMDETVRADVCQEIRDRMKKAGISVRW